MERIRSRGKVVTPPTPFVDIYDYPGASPVRSYGSYSPYVDRDEMTDVPTKGFQRRSSQGDIIVSPMSRVRSVSVVSPITVSQHAAANANPPGWLQRRWENQLVYPLLWEDVSGLPPAAPLVAAAEKEAITAAFAKVGAADTELLVSIFELPETIAMLHAPIKKGVRLVENFRRWSKAHAAYKSTEALRLQSFAKRQAYRARKGLPTQEYTARKAPVLRVGKLRASDVPSAWLAVRYGLMPLMYDIQSIHAALVKEAAETPRATARASAQRTGTERVKWSPSNPTLRQSGVDEALVYTIRSRAGVLYVPKAETFASKWGLELHRLPAAMYEAVTLSFVTDWFHNAATYYDALTSHMRAKQQLAAWVVTTVEYTLGRTRVEWSPPGSSSVWSFTPTSGPHTQVIVTRKTRRNVTLSDAGVMVYNKLNLTRIVDGLALISTFLSRRR